MADEEPKTSTSVSGNYNSTTLSYLSAFNTSLLSGLDEFTLMFWVYLDPANPSSFTVVPYTENKLPSTVINPVTFRNNNIEVKILNSGGGSTLTLFSTPPTVGEFFHCAVSGSLSNSRIRLYINGVLESSSIMSYANATMDDAQLNNSECDIAQMNLYGVELTEEEVLEHYVYDDDLLFAGVLGFDAMTAGQKANMLYSSSLIEDVSFGGNEYSDKTGNGISLTPKPSLLGEQIYIYTNADDLPSAGPQIYNVNSASFNGTSDAINLDSTLIDSSADWSVAFNFVSDSGQDNEFIFSPWKEGLTNDRGLGVLYNLSDKFAMLVKNSSGTPFNVVSALDIVVDTEYAIIIEHNVSAKTVNTYVDGSIIMSTTYTGTLDPIDNIKLMCRDYGNGNERFYGGGLINFNSWSRLLSSQEIAERSTMPAKCFDSSTDLEASRTAFIPLYNGADVTLGNELINLDDGTKNATTVGSPTYTDQGLQVECGGSPPANDNFPYTFPFNLG